MNKISQGLELILRSNTFIGYFNTNQNDTDPRINRKEFAEKLYLLIRESSKESIKKFTVDTTSPFKTDVVIDSNLITQLSKLNLSARELSSFYEQVLGLNLNDSTDSNLHRKTSGVYYTSQNLAFPLARLAVDTYIKIRLGITDYSFIHRPSSETTQKVADLLSVTRVADPSCGVARFLIAYLQYLRMFVLANLPINQHSHLCAKVCSNLYGYDVDPIAIYLAKISVASELHEICPNGQLFSLDNSFRQMNPLIASDGCKSTDIFTFLSGFLYLNSFGRPSDFEFGSWDIVLGNPPWEKVRFEEKVHFEAVLPKYLVKSDLKSEREKLSQKISVSHPKIFSYFQELIAHIDKARVQIKSDPIFSNSAISELNTGALFLELASRMVKKDKGVVGLLIKSSTLTHHANRQLFRYLRDDFGISSAHDFINKKKYFPIDSRERFTWVVLGPNGGGLNIGMNLHDPSEIWDSNKSISLTTEQIKLLSSNSDVLPSFSEISSLEILLYLYTKNSKFSDIYPTAHFGRLVHLTAHSKEILKQRVDDSLPVFEGKFIDRYDGMYADFLNVKEKDRYKPKALGAKIDANNKLNPLYIPEYRYYITRKFWTKLTKNHHEAYSLFWRSTTSSTNKRTCIATILPHSPAIQSLQMLQLCGSGVREYGILLAIMNSKTFDYLVRNRLTGIDLTQNVIKQIPVPNPCVWETRVNFLGIFSSLSEHVLCRVKYMLVNDKRLYEFCDQLQIGIVLKQTTRSKIDEELDTLIGLAYQIPQHFLLQILNSFPRTFQSISKTEISISKESDGDIEASLN